jgi:hypothetical protein
VSRHDLDAVSLLVGSVFLALGLVGLLGPTGHLEVLRWLGPLLLIGTGGTGLFLAIRRRP